MIAPSPITPPAAPHIVSHQALYRCGPLISTGFTKRTATTGPLSRLPPLRRSKWLSHTSLLQDFLGYNPFILTSPTPTRNLRSAITSGTDMRCVLAPPRTGDLGAPASSYTRLQARDMRGAAESLWWYPGIDSELGKVGPGLLCPLRGGPHLLRGSRSRFSGYAARSPPPPPQKQDLWGDSFSIEYIVLAISVVSINLAAIITSPSLCESHVWMSAVSEERARIWPPFPMVVVFPRGTKGIANIWE